MSGLGSIAKESVPPSGLEPYLNGTKLYGDDFLGEALEGWFADEREGYASIDARGGGHGEKYLSHTKNIRYGFRYLPDIAFPRVLGFGAADAREIEPVLDRVQTVTVVEPGLAFRTSSFKGVPLEYVVPNPDGTLPLASDEFDLATCFGVLHHLARVSQSVKELHRCIRPGGYLLLDEPTNSMGGWWNDRPWATKRERGIPLEFIRRLISSTGFQVLRERRVYFASLPLLSRLMHFPLQTLEPYLIVDEIACSLFSWNARYHPRSLVEWLMPTNVFYVLRKPSSIGSQ